jgi:hypothetical protein
MGIAENKERLLALTKDEPVRLLSDAYLLAKEDDPEALLKEAKRSNKSVRAVVQARRKASQKPATDASSERSCGLTQEALRKFHRLCSQDLRMPTMRDSEPQKWVNKAQGGTAAEIAKDAFRLRALSLSRAAPEKTVNGATGPSRSESEQESSEDSESIPDKTLAGTAPKPPDAPNGSSRTVNQNEVKQLFDGIIQDALEGQPLYQVPEQAELLALIKEGREVIRIFADQDFTEQGREATRTLAKQVEQARSLAHSLWYRDKWGRVTGPKKAAIERLSALTRFLWNEVNSCAEGFERCAEGIERLEKIFVALLRLLSEPPPDNR